MTDTPVPHSLSLLRAPTPSPAWVAGLRTVFLAVLLAVSIRTCIYEPFSIPSASMNPTLMAGDYILVAKYPYGYGRASLPWGELPIEGKIGAAIPERGDIVIFTASDGSGTNFVKRVIGLPGDSIMMQRGQLVIDGHTVPRRRIADYVHPVTAVTPCEGGRAVGDSCVYPQYRETIADLDIDILSLGDDRPLDDTATVVVPPDRVFVLGDHRDNSEDSRVNAEDGGFGMVPLSNIVGRADLIFMSVNGTGDWLTPSSWPDAIRAKRIGVRP